MESTEPQAPPAANSKSRFYLIAAAVLGVWWFVFFLSWHNTADNDIWAKLAIGASVWYNGEIPMEDMFAFTPTLDEYVDHEWGTGVWYFALLKVFGPFGLLLHKLTAALLAVTLAVIAGRVRETAPWALLLLALPGALCIMPGYIPVIRSHSFTYLFFALSVLMMELLRRDHRWPAVVLPLMMIVWVNVHGGFVAGLGLIGVYTLAALIENKNRWWTLGGASAAVLCTLINPWGFEYWPQHLRAVFLDRANIEEWQPLPLWRADSFFGFRVLFVIVLVSFAVGWRRVAPGRRCWPGLVMLALTAYLGWRVRRHVPFFGIMTLAVAAPYFQATLERLGEVIFRERERPAVPAAVFAFALQGLAAIYVTLVYVPEVTFRVIAPVGLYPVREADLLEFSGAEGNVATPFRWGCYLMWRLHPENRISIDGRYEAAYPHDTFDMNLDLYHLHGERPFRLLEDFDVPYVMMDYQRSALRPEHLEPLGYVNIYVSDGGSGLMVKQDRVQQFVPFLQEMPDTIQPLDAEIPRGWW